MTVGIYNKLPLFILIALLIASFVLMWNAALGDSAIFDESAHIPAGYSYVRYLDYRLNPEHPPLIKALAGLPLLFLNLRFPTDNPSWSQEVNGQWIIGHRFLHESGNDADLILQWSRFLPIIVTVLTAFLVYFWSKELLGQWWSLLPAFLFGLSPTVLAHGHYVTTDVGAAFGVILATFAFVKFLLKPTWGNVILGGLAFGIAQLTKFSNALLIPYFILLFVIFLIGVKIRNGANIQWGRHLLKIILIFLIGYVLVYAVYFLFTLNYPQEKQLNDAASILNSFPISFLVKIDLKMIENDFLRPLGQYFLGLLTTMQRAAGGNTAYFFGELSAKGWWYYFPLVFLMKEPLPSLILILAAIIFAFSKFKIKNLKFKIFADYLGTHFAEFSMLLFIIIYWAYSIQSALNIGVRHLLPTLPFIYILSAGAFKNLFQSQKTNIFKICALAILIIWYLGETIFAAPYFLSYFNEAAGGTLNGYRYVTDSNSDWGQDLKRLKKWVEENKIEKIAVDYFGGGDPKYYLGKDIAEYWWSARGNPKNENIEWLAVSANTLQGAWAKLQPDLKRKPEDEYSWLKDRKPYGRAGTSIFIYRF